MLAHTGSVPGVVRHAQAPPARQVRRQAPRTLGLRPAPLGPAWHRSGRYAIDPAGPAGPAGPARPRRSAGPLLLRGRGPARHADGRLRAALAAADGPLAARLRPVRLPGG